MLNLEEFKGKKEFQFEINLNEFPIQTFRGNSQSNETRKGNNSLKMLHLTAIPIC